ncbi:MAG: MFS transporter [Defluviitaleaceae bacterium]|nr:MFS transporter [Defluviitaleaceae bacterium]
MRKRVGLFYIVTAFFWFSLYAYVPYVTPYAYELGASLRLIGIISGAYGFTQMAIRFPLGIFSDRIGKRKVFVILGMVFASVAAFVTFFVPNPYALLLTRALGGVAASAWVTFTILGASYFPANKATKSMGNLSAWNAVGRMIALLAGGLLAQRFGLEYAFFIGGAVGLVGIFISFFVTETNKNAANAAFFHRSKCGAPPTAAERKWALPTVARGLEGVAPTVARGLEGVAPIVESPPSIKELLGVAGNKQLLSCSILGILSMFIAFATTFGFLPLAATLLYANQFQLGMLGVVSTLPGIIMAPLAGTIMPRKLGVCATLVFGFLLAGVGSALIAFTTTLPMLFIVQIIGSIGGAILGTLLLGLCIHDILPEKRATAMGFFQAVYGIGMFLGPFTVGQISHVFGLDTAFIFTGFVGIFGAALTIFYVKRKHIMY